MKDERITLKKGMLLHVETPLGIVNIRTGLSNEEGKNVNSIEVIPDQGVELDGYATTRLIQREEDKFLLYPLDNIL